MQSQKPASNGSNGKVEAASVATAPVSEPTVKCGNCGTVQFEPKCRRCKHPFSNIQTRVYALVTVLNATGSGMHLEYKQLTDIELADINAVGKRVRARLTPRELRACSMIPLSLSNKEIAKYMNTTEQVIKNLLRDVYDKVGVSDRLELAMYVVAHPSILTPIDAKL